MMDDILILFPQINVPPPLKTLLELGIYVGVLRRDNFNVRVAILDDMPEPVAFSEGLRRIIPRVVLYYIQPGQFSFLANIAPCMKADYLNVHFCSGGPMSTLDPDAVMAVSGIDSLIVGEGEVALVEFLNACLQGKEWTSIRNFWFRTPLLQVQKNPFRPLIENLDILPFPDRTFYPSGRAVSIAHGSLPMLISRGCPYNCTFCPEPQLNDIYKGKGKYDRVRSVNNIINEILSIRSQLSFRGVLFLDEIFPTNREFLEEFCELYRTRVNLPFFISAAIEQLDTSTLQLLVMAGCAGISLGIETGNEAFRKRLCNKNVGNENVLTTVSRARDMGIKIYTHNMVGLPLETDDLSQETCDLNQKISPDRLSVSVYYPIPATPLYNYSREKGYFSGRDPLAIATDESILNLPNLTMDGVKKSYHRLKKLNCALMAKRMGKPKGFFDFIHELVRIGVDGEEILPVTCDEYFIGDRQEFCLAQFQNTKLTFPITLKKQAWLNLLVGIEPTLQRFTDSTYFRFSIYVIQDSNERLLFDKYLNPEKNPKDLDWHVYEIPILDFKEGSALARFEFRTSINLRYPVLGLWGHPFLSEYTLQVQESLEEAGFSEEEFEKMRNEILRLKLLLERAEEGKRTLTEASLKLQQELEETLALAAKLQKEILMSEEEKKGIVKRLAELEEIAATYNKSISGRIRKILKIKI